MRRLYLLSALIPLWACHDPIRKTGVVLPAPVRDSGSVPSAPTADAAHTVATPPPKPQFNTVSDSVIDPVRPDPNSQLQDAFFPYDRADLTDAASAALANDTSILASALRAFPHAKIIVEGHCDERGSSEYNLALGDTRAQSAAEALKKFGLPAAAIEIVSYGKERPQCSEATEDCWQKNRRAHIAVR